MRLLISATAGVALLVSACASPAPSAGSQPTAASATNSAADAQGTIKIGFINSLTGLIQAFGTGHRQGAEFAVSQINQAGGINGRQVELLVEDDQSSPDQAVIAFNKLLSENVTAIEGPTLGNAALALLPLVDQKQIPFISSASGDQLVNPVHPYIYQVPPSIGFQVERTLQYFQGVGITRIGVIWDSTANLGQTGLADIKQLGPKYGVTIVDDEGIDPSQNDFTPAMLHLKNSDAEAVSTWMAGPSAVIVTKQYRANGLTPPLVMSPGQGNSLYTQPAGQDAEGVFVLTDPTVLGSVLPDSYAPKKALQDLQTAWSAAHNGEVLTQFNANGWLGVTLIPMRSGRAPRPPPQFAMRWRRKISSRLRVTSSSVQPTIRLPARKTSS